MIPVRTLFLAASAALLAFAPAQAAQPLPVVASFTILADMASQIGGDKIAVATLVGPDGDAHVYQPTPSDAKTLARSRLVLVNGLGMEGWLDRLVAASATKAPVIVVSQGVAPLTMEDEDEDHADHDHEKGHDHAKVHDGDDHGHHHDHDGLDPHAWQNLANGKIYAANIGAALAKADPANATYYQQRTQDYIARLDALDSWVKAEIARVPEAKRKIVTSHDAFGYFANAYGVAFLAPVGISTEAEPSAAGMGRLIEQIKKEGVKTVFVESMSSPKLAEVLAKDAGAAVGAAIYSDSLSPKNGPAPSYEAMFRHNVPLFVDAMNRE